MSTYDPHYAKRWRVDRDRGIKRYVDPGPVLEHIEALMSLGASRRAIADAAGTSTTVVCRVRDGQRTLSRRVATNILAVTYEGLFHRDNPDKFVPKIGACRRIRALMAIGHRAQDIGAAGDLDWHNVHNTLNQVGQWITRQRHEQIIRAYDALWDTRGTSPHVLARAAAAGWPPPLAWDDEDIDDPNAAPDLGQPDDTSGGRRLHLEDLEFILDDQPLATAVQLAERLGVGRDAIQHACARAGRTDLLERLARNADLRGAAA